MSVTIEDIAKEARVSVATVSRVINNSKAVSPELKKRVNDVIEKRNFKPNSLARGLIMKRTNIIGIIVPDISNPVFGALTRGINSFCQQKGYTLMVCESGGHQEKEVELLGVLADKKVDGVLFAGVDVNSALVEEMKSMRYPIVLVTQEASNGEEVIHTVIHDNVKALYDAVSFLIENGHQRIALIGGPENDYSSGQKRLKGYKQALEEQKIEVLDSYIEHGDFSFESGYECMRKIYEENSVLPTAVMVCNDAMAIGAIRFLKTSKVSVPADISIMGFDDLEFGRYFSPELTTVRISYFDEGLRAIKTLFKLIQEQSVPMTQFIPHKIIRRISVKKI
ncbi:catabolite control protein A [Paenibacillus antibioticophila]|uniref:Catabolite control protein A n=2 Tax=Paenibacillus TaxID=44249 RepID=A0A919Y6P9_9BACL|nr:MULTISPECIES: LacI family DNA-binding transcriptional regulator [Paenibacillus]GIO36520.1 catabolite control protein A [Paenibacillus antibioticophila]GIO43102.1 catabolite control protein A [Paenibacillus apis]